MMNSTIFSLIVMWLICTATTAPLDGDNHRPEVKIPPYIKKIYNKMSQAMDQDDLHTSLKYLSTVQSVHWLEPVTHGTMAPGSTGPYQHQYTVTFNISGLTQKKERPNYAELFLHVQIHNNQAAQIRITSEHIQQPVTWIQPSQANGKDDSEMAEVRLVRIRLTSLTMDASLWQNDSTVTFTVASTNVVRMPLKKHYQNAVGLVLYMGGAPEAIEKLPTTLIKTGDHKTHSIGATTKRSTGSTPCQVQKGFRVKFSEMKGSHYERIIQPDTVDIGRCVGECPLFLNHLHNPSDHAELRNLLTFREGSASSEITTATCVPTSFKPLPVMMYNEAEKRFYTKTYTEMIATSCGCR